MSYFTYYSILYFLVYNSPNEQKKGTSYVRDEQYLFIENTLRELAMYVHNCKVDEEKEKFKRQFTVVYNKESAPMRASEDSKLNRKRCKSQKVWTEKEIKEMPYLKDIKYRKTQNGIHQFRYRRDGYNVSFNSKNFEEAKKKAYDFVKGLKRILQNSADVAYGKTLDSVATAWLELKKTHSDEKTSYSYENIYNNHIKPVFGKRSIKSILPMDLQPFFDKLFSEKGRTCESAKVMLNQVFKYAIANRLCPSNPLDGVIVEKHFRTPGKALTDEQIKRFKQKMQNEGKYGLAGLIILYTGIRGAELSSLTFDWEQKTFTVNNAKLKKSQKLNPGNLQRTVPIFPSLWKLKERIETEDYKISATRLTNKFKLHWTESTVKDLRHTFSSKARESGIDNELVNVWMGHAPGKNLTANTYTHFSLEFQIEQAKKMIDY